MKGCKKEIRAIVFINKEMEDVLITFENGL